MIYKNIHIRSQKHVNRSSDMKFCQTNLTKPRVTKTISQFDMWKCELSTYYKNNCSKLIYFLNCNFSYKFMSTTSRQPRKCYFDTQDSLYWCSDNDLTIYVYVMVFGKSTLFWDSSELEPPAFEVWGFEFETGTRNMSFQFLVSTTLSCQLLKLLNILSVKSAIRIEHVFVIFSCRLSIK